MQGSFDMLAIHEFFMRPKRCSEISENRFRIQRSRGEFEYKRLFQVNGVEGLRVADASNFPLVPTGHTMAPAYLVGARCGDFIVEDNKQERLPGIRPQPTPSGQQDILQQITSIVNMQQLFNRPKNVTRRVGLHDA